MQLAIWKQQVYHKYTYSLLQFTIQQFCLLHIFNLYRRIPPVLPHMQQIKILFSNCYIQHQLMCSLMMDQEGPTHVGDQCFTKCNCELNGICWFSLWKLNNIKFLWNIKKIVLYYIATHLRKHYLKNCICLLRNSFDSVWIQMPATRLNIININ
jgi:hypothetical protein